jgi:glutathione S-transferase
MQLYGSYTSPYVRHCRIALIEAGIEAEFFNIDQAKSAEIAPTKKVPFLKDDDLVLSDSASILKYIREKSGKAFCADVLDYDLYCFASTIMDSAANVFYLEKFGLKESDNAYVARQNARIKDGFDYLNQLTFSTTLPLSDSELRIACLVDWAIFRNRFDFSAHKNLQALLALANTSAAFEQTHPFE